jgi:uncharacterized membrane protein YfcA
MVDTLSGALVALAGIGLIAAFVNGALGHGFSSVTVPLALLFLTSATLNPALVPIEVGINACVLFSARRSIPAVWRRVVPVLLGLVPGVMVGSWLLSGLDPERCKGVVYAVLLPLLLLQAAGIRRPLRAGPAAAVPFGAAIGALYAVTTISGPPLALMLNNQGLAKQEFRAAIGVIRLGESLMTATAYAVLGLYTAQSAALLQALVPAVLVGLPLGAYAIGRIPAETFRRLCMSFDVWIVSFGLARVLDLRAPVVEWWPYLVTAAAIAMDAWLLLRFFRRYRRVIVAGLRPPETVPASRPVR